MNEFHDKNGPVDLNTRQQSGGYAAATIASVVSDLEQAARDIAKIDPGQPVLATAAVMQISETERIATRLYSLAAELTQAADTLRGRS